MMDSSYDSGSQRFFQDVENYTRNAYHDVEKDAKNVYHEFENDAKNIYHELEKDTKDLYHDIKNDIKNINWKNIFRKILRYSLEGLAVSTAAYGLPKMIRRDGGDGFHKSDFWMIVKIGFLVAAIFALLDIYAPKVGIGSRIGAGIAIGAYQVGGLRISSNQK